MPLMIIIAIFILWVAFWIGTLVAVSAGLGPFGILGGIVAVAFVTWLLVEGGYERRNEK